MKKLVLVTLGIVFAVAAFLLFKVNQFYRTTFTQSVSVTNPSKPPEEKKVYNILIMGYGGAGHDGAYLTDTLMIAHVDLNKKRVNLVSLPRDLWIKVPTKTAEDFHSKINSVYQMVLYPKNYPNVAYKEASEQGAADFVKEAVKQVSGLTIDNYVAIDFTGFKKAVDLLGGVDVTVEKTFDDYEYPIDGKEDDACDKKDQEFEDAVKIATQDAVLAFPCRYEHLHFTAGTTHMDGATALKYVRSRHSLQDGTDFGRAARQQRFLEAVREKVVSITFIPKIIPLLDELKTYIRMDVSLPDINKFIGQANQSKSYKISNLVISNDNYVKNSFSDYGGFILVPKAGLDDWSEVHQAIDFSVRGITPTPTPAPTKIPSPTPRVRKTVNPSP